MGTSLKPGSEDAISKTGEVPVLLRFGTGVPNDADGSPTISLQGQDALLVLTIGELQARSG